MEEEDAAYTYYDYCCTNVIGRALLFSPILRLGQFVRVGTMYSLCESAQNVAKVAHSSFPLGFTA